MEFFIVFLGAGIGGALRHAFNLLALRLGYTAFPVGTLSVNVLGSFLIGIIAGYVVHRSSLPGSWSLFLTTGVLGGFTTFSAFSLEIVSLYQRGRLDAAAAYAGASVILSVGAVFAALALMRILTRT